MMRILIIGIALALSACTTTKPAEKTCPVPSKIGASESLTDYTVRLLKLYDECAKLRTEN